MATGGTATGDIGLFQTLSRVSDIGYIGGGLLFAISVGVALIGLGYSLWREQRQPARTSSICVVTSSTRVAPARPFGDQRAAPATPPVVSVRVP